MSIFSDVQAAAARGESVMAARLLEADFLSGASRVWEQAGPLVTLDGKTWLGLGDVLNIGTLDQVTGGQSTAGTVTLQGVTPEFIRVAVESETEARGRALRVYVQWFGEDQQPLGHPLAVSTLRMDVVSYRMGGPSERTVSISAENLLTNRKRVPFGRYTDADQQNRFPGDLGFEFVADLVDTVVTWPDF